MMSCPPATKIALRHKTARRVSMVTEVQSYADTIYVGTKRPCAAFLYGAHTTLHRLVIWRVTEKMARNGAGVDEVRWWKVATEI